MKYIFYLLDCVFINVYTYPNPKPTPYKKEKILIIVVQCDKNYAVLMCACPVAPYVSLLSLTVIDIYMYRHVYISMLTIPSTVKGTKRVELNSLQNVDWLTRIVTFA